MEKGSYLLVLRTEDNRIVEDYRLMGAAPCWGFETLAEAERAADEMERDTIYLVDIVQIVRKSKAT